MGAHRRGSACRLGSSSTANRADVPAVAGQHQPRQSCLGGPAPGGRPGGRHAPCPAAPGHLVTRHLRRDDRAPGWRARALGRSRPRGRDPQRDRGHTAVNSPGSARGPSSTRCPGTARWPGVTRCLGTARWPGVTCCLGTARWPGVTCCLGTARWPGVTRWPGITRCPGAACCPGAHGWPRRRAGQSSCVRSTSPARYRRHLAGHARARLRRSTGSGRSRADRADLQHGPVGSAEPRVGHRSR